MRTYGRESVMGSLRNDGLLHVHNSVRRVGTERTIHAAHVPHPLPNPHVLRQLLQASVASHLLNPVVVCPLLPLARPIGQTEHRRSNDCKGCHDEQGIPSPPPKTLHTPGYPWIPLDTLVRAMWCDFSCFCVSTHKKKKTGKRTCVTTCMRGWHPWE
jgi:hypothetical protein